MNPNHQHQQTDSVLLPALEYQTRCSSFFDCFRSTGRNRRGFQLRSSLPHRSLLWSYQEIHWSLQSDYSCCSEGIWTCKIYKPTQRSVRKFQLIKSRNWVILFFLLPRTRTIVSPASCTVSVEADLILHTFNCIIVAAKQCLDRASLAFLC